MMKGIVIAVCIGLILWGLADHVKGEIRKHANRCFVDAIKEHQAANPGKVVHLRDIPLQKTAECTQSRNSSLENLFFDKANIGDYIRIKPTPSESKKNDATK